MTTRPPLVWDGTKITQLATGDNVPVVNIPPIVAVTMSVTQSSHGFAVGNVLKYSGSSYAKAQADSAANAEVVGIVSTVTSSNIFVLTMAGYVSGLSSLTAGTTYFLSTSSAGALTTTAPSTAGQIWKPLLNTDSTTSGIFSNYLGLVVPSTTTASTTVTITTSQTASVGFRYFTNSASLVTVTLPSTASVGDLIRVDGRGLGLWKIGQNSGQVIHGGSPDTTVGTGGSLTAQSRYDCVTLVCMIANTDWIIEDERGTLTVV